MSSYIYKGKEVKNLLTGNVIVKPGDPVSGDLIQISPGNAVQCIATPCPIGTTGPVMGIKIENKNGFASLAESDLDPAVVTVSKNGNILSAITKKQAVVTIVAVLFITALFFNKQIRSFFNA